MSKYFMTIVSPIFLDRETLLRNAASLYSTFRLYTPLKSCETYKVMYCAAPPIRFCFFDSCVPPYTTACLNLNFAFQVSLRSCSNAQCILHCINTPLITPPVCSSTLFKVDNAPTTTLFSSTDHHGRRRTRCGVYFLPCLPKQLSPKFARTQFRFCQRIVNSFSHCGQQTVLDLLPLLYVILPLQRHSSRRV